MTSFISQLTELRKLRCHSVEIECSHAFQHVHQVTRQEVDMDVDILTPEVCQWFSDLAVNILEGHHSLEVVFVRSDDGVFYAAAQRVNGYIVVMRGPWVECSLYRFPNGLLDEENVLPRFLRIPDKHPPSKVLYLTDD